MRCPVCRAGFRSTSECSRCGADLTPLMHLVVKSHRLREKARLLLFSQELEKAQELLALAQSIHATPAGRRMRLLATLAGLGCDREEERLPTTWEKVLRAVAVWKTR